jgi:hypothetical protein
MSEQTFTFEEALNTVGTGIGLQNAIDLVRAAHSRALAAATEEMKRECDEARAERDKYWNAMRTEWQEVLTRAEKAEAERVRYRDALTRLAREAASWEHWEVLFREVGGNTNYACLMNAVKEARAAIEETKP